MFHVKHWRGEILVKDLFSKYNISIDDNQVAKFNRYYELLIEWNQKINLTTITDYQDVKRKHFFDSCLLLMKYSTNEFKNKKVIDVGTGGGFPGIPLAILLPETHFTLIDSLNKRIDFLKVVIKELHLDHVKLVHGRAEDLGQNDVYREQFDYCVSRAVAVLPLLLEYCSPFIKKGGFLFLYKSKKVSQELLDAKNAFNQLSCQVKDNVELIKDKEYERYILIIEKYQCTPDKYPRKAGKPKKKPL